MDSQAPYGNSVGDRLRAAREAQGLTLDQVASETRIPTRHLRSIEDGQWDDLPAVTYTVGFARAYANAVGLDGPAIGQELRDQLGGTTRAPTVSPEIYAPPDPSRVPSRGLAWGAFILLIVLIGAWLLVIRPWLTRGDEVAEPAPAPAAEQKAPEQAAPAQPATPASLAGQPVTLAANDEVWFQVNDGPGGPRVYVGVLARGQTYQVPPNLQQPVIRTGLPQRILVRVGDRELGRLNEREQLIRNQSLRPEDLGTLFAQRTAQPGTPPAR